MFDITVKRSLGSIEIVNLAKMKATTLKQGDRRKVLYFKFKKKCQLEKCSMPITWILLLSSGSSFFFPQGNLSKGVDN